PVQAVVLAALLLLAISAAALLMWRRQPSFLVGWLWFLGTLVPVIGFVQAGLQSMADRYAYLPSVGIFIALSWLLPGLLFSGSIRRTIAVCFPVTIVLAALGVLTFKQAGYWIGTKTLFEHAVAVTPDNAVARNNLGNCLMANGDLAGAQTNFTEAVRLK